MSSLLKGSRKLILGIGLAGAGAAVWAIMGGDEDKAFIKASAFYDHYINNPRYFYEPPVSHKWDFNWDRRQSDTLMKTLEGKFRADGDKNASKEKLQKAKVIASRHLLFIRHGQYALNGKTDEERTLTELGRQQAYFAAQRLKELNLPYSQIVQSTMTRAKQTAQIISKELPDIPVSSSDLLREGLPIVPEPSSYKELDNLRAFTDGPRIEAAFRRYFYRAKPDQKEDSYEIFVCHANVIRYFVCRALQLPPEAWLRFSLHNCSMTWIAIRPSGRVSVYTVGDCGFIPSGKLTTN